MADPTIAIAFGAGGARGLAHVQVLLALDELGVKASAVSGSSMGSIMAAAYAGGMTGQEVYEFAEQRFEVGQDLLTDLWRLRPGSIQEFLAEGGVRLGELNVEKIMEIFLPQQLPENLEDLHIQTHIVATDYYGQIDKDYTTGNLRKALAASSAIPAVFRPVIIEGTVLIDGGITNPVPFDVLAGQADVIMGIDVAGGPEGEAGIRPGKVDVLYASSQLMQQSIARAKAEAGMVDIFLSPRIGNIRVLDFMKSKEILKITKPFREEAKAAISAAFENHIKG